MKKHICSAVLTLCVFLSMNTHSQSADDAAVRAVAVPTRENGYSNFETTVIASKADLDQFLKKVAAQPGWNDQAGFSKAITEAKLDFSKELLVLIRRDEGSGSVQVTFHKPVVEGKKVVCKIDRKLPEIGTADMAFYCHALAVAKDGPSEIELQVQGGQPVNIPLKKE